MNPTEYVLNLLKRSFAQESITMEMVNVARRLEYYSKCPHFKNCPFNRTCLVDPIWSMDICIALIKLVREGLVVLNEGEQDHQISAREVSSGD